MRFSKATLVIAAAALTSQAAQANPMQIRSMAAACANCHGTKGVALDGMDTLAGKPKDELLKKLIDFKTGKERATVMDQLSKGYTDEELTQLAEYFSALRP